MVIFRQLGEKVGPRVFAPIESAGHFLQVALPRWTRAASESEVQQVVMSPVERLSLPEHDCASCR